MNILYRLPSKKLQLLKTLKKTLYNIHTIIIQKKKKKKKNTQTNIKQRSLSGSYTN